MASKARDVALVLALGLLAACAGPQSEVEKQEAAQTAYDIGLGALAEGNMPKAIAELRKAVESSPNNARYHHALGNAYLRGGETDQAIVEFRRAVELDPRLAEAYNDLGAAYTRREQWDRAIDAFRKALANPRYLSPERAYTNLGNIYMVQGRYAMAAEEFRRVMDIVPQSPDGYFFLGRALLAQGKTAEAKEQFEKAVRIDGTIPIFQLELGKLQMQTGDRAQAREHLQRAVDLNPAGPEAAEARRRLQELK
jgi:type IV pilus biogenesis/stability protein PilW